MSVKRLALMGALLLLVALMLVMSVQAVMAEGAGVTISVRIARTIRVSGGMESHSTSPVVVQNQGVITTLVSP
ncbi:MAG: hypothetical protein V1748_11945 [Actinomycetota bacterium]